MEKSKTMFSLICLILICVGIADAAVAPPLVKLLFDDAAGLSTANLGSLGGTQNLPPVSGWKDAGNPPVGFDSGKAWVQAGYAPTGYGDFNLPAMSSVTVAFWVDAIYADDGFRNIFGSNFGTSGGEFGAYVQSSNLYLLGPSGTRYIIATNVIPTATPTWTHVAYTYNSSTGVIHLYINGIEVGYSGSWSGTIPAGGDGLGFSFCNTTASNNLYGLVDNLFVFDRVLTREEMQNLMVTNAPRKVLDPIVKLLFDDANSLDTANLGLLGGIQNLPSAYGMKDATNLPPVNFDSGNAWTQTNYAQTGYGTYNLPEMSSVTMAFWVRSINAGGFANIFASNLGTSGEEIGVYVSNGTILYILGPDGSRYITANVLPVTPTWTHVAYTYDYVTGGKYLYINGEPVALSGYWVGPIAESSDGLGFSFCNTTGSSNLCGSIDNLFIFDRSLTKGEVQDLMMTNVAECEYCYEDEDEDVVLPGFEPLNAGINDVNMWERIYHFNGAVMPTQITNQDADMLADPINWYLKSGSPTYSLQAVSSVLAYSSPTRALYKTTGTLGGFSVSGNVLVEYDGFMKFDLEFTPTSGSVVADKLYMDIPFAPSCATNMFYPLRRSGKWDNTWDSNIVYTQTNVITIGTPDICLQWLTESDQYYYPAGSLTALETFDDPNGTHVFRMNVINSTKTVTSPFKLTFALQAGPVKARPANWRAWTMSPVKAEADPNLYNNIGYYYVWWARSPGETIPRRGFPVEPNEGLYANEIHVASAHFAGYRSYEETDPNVWLPEWQIHQNEWLRIPTIWEDQSCPGWANAYVDTDSSWSQWHVDNTNQLFSLTGMRGLYYDDWRQGPSINELAGSGYRDEQNVLHATQPIFSQRELHRKVYAIVKKNQPDDGMVIIHTASATFLPIVSFCDVIYDGEIMIWTDMVPPAGDYFRTYTNDLFQAAFQSKQFGPVFGFHDMTTQQFGSYPEIVGPNYLDMSNQRKLWSILLTHDIHMQCAFTSLEEVNEFPWLHSFGMAEPNVVFHPYWETDPAVEVDGSQEPQAHLWASAYSKPGKALAVVVRDAPNFAWSQTGYAATGYGTYNLPAMSSVTVSFWVYAINVDTSFRNIFGSNFGTSGGEFGAYVQSGTLNLAGPGGTRYITANVIPTATPTWTHVAYTYDSSTSAFNLYINGQSVSKSGSWSGTIPAASDGLGVSICNTTGSANLYGSLDNLFVINSVLTQAQVQTLMNTNAPPTGCNPLVKLLFDDVAPMPRSTVNFGSLGGTQNLPPVSGVKDPANLPPITFGSSLDVNVVLDRNKLGLPAGPLNCTSLESLGTSPLGVVVGDILTVPVGRSNFAGVIIKPDPNAYGPNPATGAVNVSLTPTLSWTAGYGVASHDVYFGTNQTNVTNANHASAEYKGNQAGTSYVPGTLTNNTTYYWRIDEVGTGGTTKGTVWSFTSIAAVPTFVAAGAVTSGTGTITPSLPVGITTGDILLLFLETSNQAISISNQNNGTWTAVTNSPQGTGTAAGTTGARLTVFWSRYNGTQGAPTASDSGDHQMGRIIAIRGAVSTGNPWDVTAGGVEAASDTSGSIPGATTTVGNTLVVVAIASALPDATGTANFSSWTNANLASVTERTDNTVTAGNGGGLGVATGIKATAGAYGNTAVTLASSAYKGMMSVAIKP